MTSERAGWEELRREIEALPGDWDADGKYHGDEISRAAVLAIVDRLAATRGEPAPRENGRVERLERIFGDMELGLGDASHVGALVNEARRVLAAARGEPPEPGLREALRDANAIIAMTREHLAKDHPDCAYTALGVMNDASRAALVPDVTEPVP